MQQTIKKLQARVDELERLTGHSPSQLPLHQPYSATTSRAGTPLEDFHEPPANVRGELINAFLDSFVNTGFFFLDPAGFSDAALRSLPFGHGDRPAPALLCAIYLWGSIRSLPQSHNADAFLRAAIQNLPVNNPSSANFAQYPILVLQTIQAQVLLSLYYLHTGLPAQGRHHAATAASLALSADLHHLHAPLLAPQPQFALARAAPAVSQMPDTSDSATCVEAFWAVAIVNNCWVAAQGGPSAISYSTSVETPWPGGTRAGATISRFLNGHDSDGFSSIALLAKASTLIERVIAAGARISGLDPTVFNTLSQRIDAFHALLPPPPIDADTDRALMLAHALTLLATIHLHAPPRGSRSRIRAAANAITELLEGLASRFGRGDPGLTHPMLGPVAAAAASAYANEIAALRLARLNSAEAQDSLERILRAMRLLAPGSPVMQLCLQSVPAQA